MALTPYAYRAMHKYLTRGSSRYSISPVTQTWKQDKMTKTPSTQPASSTSLTPAEASMLLPDDITVSVKNGKRTVEGYNQSGEKVVIQTTVRKASPSRNNGFRSQTMTVCDQLPAEERREVARQLKQEENLSQVEIARRLGVSQKTISNDLRYDSSR